jgi:NAD(P)-dependent dehydrogenase (short-subunit alcohol dehydrogenase family)
VNKHNFEGRVAVVTGAGRGIGRSYARLLADRGASVVVNDLGGSMKGVGVDAEVASTVAAEIVATGGAAVADTSDVATTAGAEALIQAAVEQFGRLDILVNNAGIIRWAGFPDADAENLAAHLAVHVGGSFNTARAAWPHMVERGYGRIVMTTSTGLFGLPENLSYATAKGAVIGLTRSLTTAGAAHGIKVNLIAPAAFTRMAGQPETADSRSRAAGSTQMSPDLVAPMVAFLAHESCPVSGEIYTAGAGRFARLFIASTEGYVPSTPEPTIEDVAQNWAAINDETGYYVPADLMAWSAAFMAHLSPVGGEPAAS